MTRPRSRPNALALDDSEDPVHAGDGKLLHNSVRPINFELINLGESPQPEMDALVRAGTVASAAEHIGALADSSGRQEHFCADGIAGALGTADEFQGQPVVGVLDHVPKQGRRGIHIVEDNVDVAVVEEIAESGAASRNDGGESAACRGRNFLEFCAVEIAKKLRALGPRGAPFCAVGDGVDVAVGDEDVQKAIVVKVEKAGAPGEKRNCRVTETGAERDVCEIAVAVVAIKRFIVVGKGGDEKVELAVAIVIAEGDAHGGLGAAFFVDSETTLIAHIFKGAVATVVIEVVGCGIVGDDKVEPTVVVEVGENRSEAVTAFAVGDAGFETHVVKRAVAIVMEEMVAFADQSHGTAKHRDATVLASPFGDAVFPGEHGMVEVVIDVAGNEKIKQAIVVVVSPGGAGGPVLESDAGPFGDVGEGAVVVVVIEAVFAVVGYVDVRPAIVVVVGDGDAEAPALVSDAGLVSDVSKRAVMVVVEEHGAGRWFPALNGGDRGTVEEINVEPAVVVVIEESDAGARGVDDGGFFGRTGAVVEFIETRLLCDIEKNDRSTIHKPACGDGAGEGVFDGSVSAPGGHAGRTERSGRLGLCDGRR